MSALLSQISELLSECHATISYGSVDGCRCMGCYEYIITFDDSVYTGDSLSEAVASAWSWHVGEEK